MLRVKRRIDAGCVCEQIVYTVPDRVQDVRNTMPRPRFRDEDERLAHKRGIARRRNAQEINANFSPASLYSTLTLDNDHEVHTFHEARKIRDLFVRRLKYHVPDAVIFLYMGRGKSTHRIHFHMISNNVPEELICKLWKQGDVKRIVHLREHNKYNGVDHGQDYTGLANYLFDHWTPEQGNGWYYKKTANAKKPSRQNAKPVKREYSENRPPRAPKGYVLVESRSTKYGYLYYKYVLQPPKSTRRLTKDKGGG